MIFDPINLRHNIAGNDIRFNRYSPVSPGVVGWWPLAAARGNRVYDLVGAQHGTLQNGATLVSQARYGRGVSGSGGTSNDNVDLGAAQSPIDFGTTQEFTIAVWAMMHAGETAGALLYKGTGNIAASAVRYAIRQTNGTPTYRTYVSDGTTLATVDVTGPAANVPFMYITRQSISPDSIEARIDLGSWSTFAGGGTNTGGDLRFLIYENTGNEWDGELYQVIMWNRFLSDSECDYLYHNPYALYTPITSFIPAQAAGGTTKAVSDTGAGADSLSQLAVALTAIDAGGGTDGFTGQAALGVVDGGAGSDALAQVIASLTLLDGGAGSDALTALTAQVTLAETGSGLDGINLSVYLPVTDTGAGSDAVNVLTGVLVSLADAGSGSDVISSLAVSLALVDAGSGSDLPNVTVSLNVADAGSGADLVGVLMGTLIAVADAASGADALGSVAVRVNLAESGLGADGVGQLLAALSLLDAGSGVEMATKLDMALDIVTITFSLARRVIAFSLARRTLDFALN